MIIRASIVGMFLMMCSLLQAQDPGEVCTDSIGIEIRTTLFAGGDSLCVEIVGNGFDSILNMQFSIRYNPNILRPNCSTRKTEFNGNIPLFDDNFLVVNCAQTAGEDQDYISLFWNDERSAEGISLPDGTVFLKYNFGLQGAPCESSPIFISDNPTIIEFVKSNGKALTNGNGITFESDTVEIESTTIGIFDRVCNVSAPGATDGSITFYPCGGEEPYEWKFDGVPQSGTLLDGEEVTIPNLGTGTYTVMVTDANGVTAMKNVQVEIGLDAIDFELIAVDPTCFTRTNGRMRVENVTGGFSPYDVEWSNFEFGQVNATMPDNQIRNLGTGTYSVTLTDILGCSVTKTDSIFVDTLFGEVEIIDSAACDGGFGVIKIRASGGDPFGDSLYLFNNVFPPMNCLEIAVPSGATTANVEDESGCRIEIDYDMPVREGVTMMTNITDVSCFGLNDGGFTAMPMGDVSYRWEVFLPDGSLSPNQGVVGSMNTFIMQNLAINSASNQDTFILQLTGNTSNCSTRDTIYLNQPETLDVQTIVGQPTCNGNDGSIRFDILGGNDPFMFSWSDTNMDMERNDLPGGMYAVTITDDRGCQDSARVELQDGGMLLVNVFASQAIQCGGGTNGSITAEPVDSGNFFYEWSTELGGSAFSMDQTPTGLGAGTYYVTITNTDLNCFVVDSTFLVEPGNITISVDSVAPSCAVFTNGRLGISVLEGVSPFEFMWEDDPNMDVSNSVLTSIGAGTYNVTITDAAGCTLDTTLVLGAPPEVFVNVNNIVGLDCFGDLTGEATAMASGGMPVNLDYTFLWSSGSTGVGFVNTATDLPAGTQWVLVGDGFCPSDTAFFEVMDAAMINLSDDTGIMNPACNNECTGSIVAVAQGGALPYMYQWEDGPSGPTRTGLCAGEYVVLITDRNGCSQTDTVILSNPDTLIASINTLTTVELSCNGGFGQIGIATIGGVDGGYAYMWDNSPSTEAIAPDLSEGTYSVTVSDNAGCTDTVSYSLTQPDPLIVNIGPIQTPECFGGQTCFSVESASGGVGDSYTFTVGAGGPRIPLDSCVMLFAGEQTIFVFDSSGQCTIEEQIIINQPNPVDVDAGPDIEIDLGETTDPINLIINADNAIDTIFWNPVDFIDCITDDCQIVSASPNNDLLFMVNVIDAAGCIGTDEVFVRVNTRRRVVFPNIFSPNNDASNDRFQIGVGNGVVQVNYMKIYDRWGNLMFEENDYLPLSTDIGGWDGNYNGSPVGSGVYAVIAEVSFSDGKSISYQKSLTLVR